MDTGLELLKNQVKEYLLSITMFILGGYTAFHTVSNGLGEINHILNFVSSVFMIFMGVILFVYKKKDKMKAVGLCALALGFNRITTSIPYVSSMEDSIFFYGMIMASLGASLMYSGYVYLNGQSRNASTMRIASLVTIGMYLFSLLTYHINGFGFDYYLERHSVDFVTMIMYVMYSIVLYDNEIAENTPTGKIRMNTSSVLQNKAVSESSFILREDVEKLFSIMETENQIQHTGPIDSEINIPVFENSKESYMILQKWKNSDRIHVTFSNNICGSYSGSDFSYTHIESDSGKISDCSHITLYSDCGRIMKIAVKDRTEVLI